MTHSTVPGRRRLTGRYSRMHSANAGVKSMCGNSVPSGRSAGLSETLSMAALSEPTSDETIPTPLSPSTPPSPCAAAELDAGDPRSGGENTPLASDFEASAEPACPADDGGGAEEEDEAVVGTANNLDHESHSDAVAAAAAEAVAVAAAAVAAAADTVDALRCAEELCIAAARSAEGESGEVSPLAMRRRSLVFIWRYCFVAASSSAMQSRLGNGTVVEVPRRASASLPSAAVAAVAPRAPSEAAKMI
mmetsp:Transcript_75967/g.246568  ORF Transcript_75967/g.246568 Transcript_75967/m.246568 type:complete len:248 (+) Transcript_75967:507-1250(+)